MAEICGQHSSNGPEPVSTRVAPADKAPDHDRYIGRVEAVATQPDGTRALITNIDADDEERARFWSLVEKHEAVASPDQMSLRIGDRPAFWAAVSNHADCPDELKQALRTHRHDEKIRFSIPSGKAMRAFLAEQPGWVRPTRVNKNSEEKPFASFHDGRKGRVQYRIVCELPNELGIKEKFEIVQEFTQVFEERSMPFVAVMHAPDHNNNEKNWHFHLIYYDRPCRRISSSDIATLSQRGFNTDALEPGMWDFSVVTPKRGRRNGKATPLKQNKITEVTSEAWIKDLRHELAAITNRHLEMAGAKRRLDPRRYTEMGIVADPQEHLGTNQAAAETRGEMTKTGSANEQRQWNAIMAEADARYRQSLAEADDRVAGYRKTRRGRPQTAAAEQEAASLRERLHRAARLDDIAFRLHHGIERARSRACHTRQANRQLLQAFDADPAAGRPQERHQSERLFAASSDYLDRLDERLTDEYALLADCRRDAETERRHPLGIERLQSVEPVVAAKRNDAERTIAEAHRSAPLDSAREPVESDGGRRPVAKPEPSEAAKHARAMALAAARSMGR